MTGKRKTIKQIAFYVVVAALVFILLIPIIWAILLSFKTNNEIVNTPLSFPTSWNFENYVRALETIDFGSMYFNTLILVLVSTFFSIVITFMSSFAIARLTFRKKQTAEYIYLFFLAGIAIPIYVLIFPIYRIDSAMGILGTRLGLIIPYVAVNISFNTLLFTGFLREIPGELEEAALIDGCNLFKICTRVVIPVMKPTFVTIVIFNAVYIYNEFPFASTFIQDSRLNTVSLMTSMFKGQYSMDYSAIIAASLLIMLPELIFYIFLQKYIISGMTSGAVKG
ncbi:MULTISPECIES: carbohydrate ABC transporter permease [Mediterraneibacter]|jgi:raffinose/stachyose/melibiose transport system permease protein|uniref:carbohydrate ABC transporter permease n=1 Tax=Mediterraneibacter TaxID=2316020 RepID=UPI000E488405|nr:carbohydrate ABC transporter permease [Mediterraneibacter massiliensis]RGT71861.1 carbohydrate ABC transporter permease [Ruminococcus sp. AF18-22]